MSYLRPRAPGDKSATYVSIGVRGESAAAIVADARSYAQARGVTFGSLVMEALAQYMDQAHLEAREAASEAASRE